jgi:Zn finger protein HypA/HybF involved in hydrogenase expression
MIFLKSVKVKCSKCSAEAMTTNNFCFPQLCINCNSYNMEIIEEDNSLYWLVNENELINKIKECSENE